jgi:hypothetical protein
MEQSDTVAAFCCYAHKDADFLCELKTHLSSLERLNVMKVWDDGDISAGAEWGPEIKKHLNEAKIILLLISPAFINSDYCYSTEMQHALERHKQGEARVIPIIVRHIAGWEKVPPGNIQLGDLQALPKEAMPVKSWTDRDEAWKEVTEGIEKAIKDEREFAQNLRNDVSPSLPTNRVGQTSGIAEPSGRTEQVFQPTASEVPPKRTRMHILKRIPTRRVPLLAIFALIVLIGGIIAYGQWHPILSGASGTFASTKNLDIRCLSSLDSGNPIGPGCGRVLPLQLTLTEIDTTHNPPIWHFKLTLLQGTTAGCDSIAFWRMELTDEEGISYSPKEPLKGRSWSLSFGQSQPVTFTFDMHSLAGKKYALNATIQACSVQTIYETTPIPT